MKTTSSTTAPISTLQRWLIPALLVAAVFGAYANTLKAPLLFDDLSAITNNPTIRHLSTALNPPADGRATTGRPLVNLSFALNHAISGEAVWSYHALNILIHAAATLALCGLLRRTPGLTTASAGVIALLWAVHPLQTESVSCIAQRTESLCGLWYLLTLYGFVRGGRWLVVSVAACLAGMASKEVMGTAPLVVLLYDRTFVAGSFAGAWRARRGYYAALAATWLLLAWLVLGAGGTRGTAAGLGLGVSGWSYLLTQCEALVLYLKLSVWPHPLVVDYGTEVVSSWTAVWWQGLIVVALLGATLWALVRRPALGFLGASFFLILAPSSSFIPLISQTMAEHRMYLPLAAVIALLGAGTNRWLGRRSVAWLLALAVVAGALTIQRNRVYRTEQAVWENVLLHRPTNARALNNLGSALLDAGRLEEAEVQFQKFIRLDPGSVSGYINLCSVLRQLGRGAEAVVAGQTAVRLNPESYDAQLNLAAALAQLDRKSEAMAVYETALRLQPDATEVAGWLATAHFDWGNRLAENGDFGGAIAHYRRVVALEPSHVQARNNLANALLLNGQVDEAIVLYRQILVQQPGDAGVEENLARALELKR